MPKKLKVRRPSAAADRSAPATTAAGRRFSAAGLAPVAALLGLTLLAYVPAMRAGFIWDDPDYVIENATLRSLDGLRQIWFVPRALPQWYPAVHTTFWIEYQLWGLWASGYHVVNILLHGANAALLYAILRKLQFPAAALAAAVFALHPVHVESVAWVTERKNVLSGFFYLLAFRCYLSIAKTGTDPVFAARGRYACALALFLLALLSKTVTCSLPATILLVIWWKRGRVKDHIVLLIPFFLIGAVFAGITAYLESQHVGATGTEFDFRWIDRVLIAGRAVWFYFTKLIAPVQLSFIYPKWAIDTGRAWQYLFPLAAVLTLAALWMLRHRIGRGPLVALLFFGGTLLPALGFVNVYPMRYSFVADHFQYLASIGPIALLTAWAGTKNSSRPYFLILVFLGFLTFRQAGIYHDRLTLWTDTVAKNPHSWMVHTNLGDALADGGEAEKAFKEYQLALQLAPHLPETHWNVGVGLALRNRFDEAMAQYDEALRLSNDQFPQARYSRGNVLLERGQVEAAKAEYERAIAQKPGLAEAHFKLGFIAESQKRPDDAIRHYTAAVQHRIGFAEGHYNLANVLLSQRRLDEALVHYSQVLKLEPRRADAHTNIGWTFLQLGQVENAIRAFNTALSIDPSLIPAQRGLERANQQRGG